MMKMRFGRFQCLTFFNLIKFSSVFQLLNMFSVKTIKNYSPNYFPNIFLKHGSIKICKIYFEVKLKNNVFFWACDLADLNKT